MPISVFPSASRGHVKQDWLESWFSFSFANYYNPQRMGFGALRVLNDDIIDAGTGFDMHPHANMEIVTIPLEGGLRHKDSSGGEGVIKAGDVQIMSAGTGIVHSEHNASHQFAAHTLQIWVLPEKIGIKPRYDQKVFAPDGRRNQWQTLVSPQANSGALWINQNAYFSRIELEAGKSITYATHDPANGVFLFVIEGSVTVEDKMLFRRDAAEITDIVEVELKAQEFSDLLAIEVPMVSWNE